MVNACGHKYPCRHCEERSDVAIQKTRFSYCLFHPALRYACTGLSKENTYGVRLAL
jgi:hypothetical protein